MFCGVCGFPIEAEDRFCRRCGKLTAAGSEIDAGVERRLRRSQEDRKLAGVCGGVARYFGKSPKLVRAVWTGAALLPFSPGLIAYGLCWAVLPREKRAESSDSRPRR